MSAHVKCRNRDCRLRVPLSEAQCAELWSRLRVSVTCPSCATAFVKEVVKAPRERPAPPTDAPPIPPPAGATRQPPPFRPLAAPPAAGPKPRPPAPIPFPPIGQAPVASVAPTAAPFAPLAFDPADRAKASRKGGGGRLSKRRQNLLVTVVFLVAVGFTGAVKLRGQLAPAVTPAEADAAPPTPPAPSEGD